MNRRRYLAVGGGLLLLMTLSAALGATLALRSQERRLAQGSPPGPARVLLERLNRWESMMDLSPEQRRAVEPALLRAREDVRALAEETARRSMEIRQRLRAEIEPVLTPTQRARWTRGAGAAARAWERGRAWGSGGPESRGSGPESSP